MNRQSLTLKNKDEFSQFSPKSEDEGGGYVKQEDIQEFAEKQGFTAREGSEKLKKTPYTKQFSTRCREGMEDLILDIVYRKKIKRQNLFELSILAYLEKNNFQDLIEKYKGILKNH